MRYGLRAFPTALALRPSQLPAGTVEARREELGRLQAEAGKWEREFKKSGSEIDQKLRDRSAAAVERQEIAIAEAAEAEEAALRQS